MLAGDITLEFNSSIPRVYFVIWMPFEIARFGWINYTMVLDPEITATYDKQADEKHNPRQLFG